MSGSSSYQVFAGIEGWRKRLQVCEDRRHARILHSHSSCTRRLGLCVKRGLLEEHEGFGGDVLNNMVGFFVNEILLEHVNLVVLEHNPFCDLAQAFNLSGETLILVDLLHEARILLGLSGVNRLGPPSLPVQHPFLASAHPHCVHLVHGQVGDVI